MTGRGFCCGLGLLVVLAWPLNLAASGWSDWWLTPDQQGDRLSSQGEYLAAAERYEDPFRKGTAFYRGGDFERAAAVFGRISTAEAAFNRGNSLVLLGRYDAAIESYQSALSQQPGWTAAADNLAIARVRKARLAPPDSDAGGTGGMLGADEIVFDETGRVNKGGTEVETEGGEAMSDSELRSVWLRRVQDDPADFLRARFSYQLYRQDEEDSNETPPD